MVDPKPPTLVEDVAKVRLRLTLMHPTEAEVVAADAAFRRIESALADLPHLEEGAEILREDIDARVLEESFVTWRETLWLEAERERRKR